MERETIIQRFLDVINKLVKKEDRDIYLVEFNKPTIYQPDKSNIIIPSIDPVAFTHVDSLRYDYGIGGCPPDERKFIIGFGHSNYTIKYLLTVIKEPKDRGGLTEYSKIEICELKNSISLHSNDRPRDIFENPNLDKKLEVYLNPVQKKAFIIENKTKGDKFLEDILKKV